MKDTEEIIWDLITKTAKTRFDYKSFAATFEDFDDDSMAEGFLFKIIIGLASEEPEDQVAKKLNKELAIFGVAFEAHALKEIIKHKKDELKTEVHVTQFAHAMLSQGSDPLTVLQAVNKMLF